MTKGKPLRRGSLADSPYPADDLSRHLLCNGLTAWPKFCLGGMSEKPAAFETIRGMKGEERLMKSYSLKEAKETR